MFHKLRHHDPVAYKEAIRHQNDFLPYSRVIPLEGVTEELMYYLEDDLANLDGIYAIHRNKNTSITGRWNLMTTTDSFHTLVAQLQKYLPAMVDKYVTDDMIPPSFCQIGLSFKKPKSRTKRNYVQKLNFEPEFTSGTSLTSTSSLDSLSTFSNDEHTPPKQCNPNYKQQFVIPSTTAELLPQESIQKQQSIPNEIQILFKNNAQLTQRVEDLSQLISTLQDQQQHQIKNIKTAACEALQMSLGV